MKENEFKVPGIEPGEFLGTEPWKRNEPTNFDCSNSGQTIMVQLMIIGEFMGTYYYLDKSTGTFYRLTKDHVFEPVCFTWVPRKREE